MKKLKLLVRLYLRIRRSRKNYKTRYFNRKIDKICYEFINDHRAYRCFIEVSKVLLYFLNHVVCHGIPSDKILDRRYCECWRTAFKEGWHRDTSRMFKIGEVSIKAEKLINTTYEFMMKAISIVKEGST